MASPSEGLRVEQEHYVYMYFDKNDEVRYVGYGRETQRAASHQKGTTHNEGLEQFLAERDFRLEIAGPFEEEPIGRAVETAVISAITRLGKKLLNIDPGKKEWRFRPLGVPLKFADRLTLPELKLHEFLWVQGKSPTPVLFVIVTDKDLGNRVGYDPANPPTDYQIRERVDRRWQLQRFRRTWAENGETGPGLLIGVFGSPGRQIVIASARIDRDGWATAELFDRGRLRVPLHEPADLDAFGFRGRRISKSAGLMFGAIPAQYYIILGTDGAAIGGHHSRNQKTQQRRRAP